MCAKSLKLQFVCTIDYRFIFAEHVSDLISELR